MRVENSHSLLAKVVVQTPGRRRRARRTCDQQSVGAGWCRGSEASGSLERLPNIDPACLFLNLPEAAKQRGDNMTIARIIAITAVVCAAIGMTTQAEAASKGRRRKPHHTHRLRVH